MIGMSKMMKYAFLLFCISIPFIASAKKILLPQNFENGKNVLKQSMLTVSGAEYVLRYKYDLLGDTITMPKGASLSFNSDASISNGFLKGNDSNIKADAAFVIFYGIQFGGDWNVRHIYSTWFNMNEDTEANTSNFRSMCMLTGDNHKGTIYIARGNYSVKADKKYPSVMVLNSNTELILDGTIILEGNELESCNIIDIDNRRNIVVHGLGIIMGDVTTHIGDKGQWGMGISVQSSDNVDITDIKIKNCWGDCIYVGQSIRERGSICHNVRIQNVVCESGRRQGLSIIAGKDILVKNCKFIKIGSIKFTAPGAGIDIEPNHPQTITENIIIDGCSFGENNKGKDLAIINLDKTASIKIRNCSFDHKLVFWDNSYNIEVENCVINILDINKAENIIIKNSLFKKNILPRVRKQIKVLKNCSFPKERI